MISSLEDISHCCEERAGGKASSLARLHMAGIRIPSGFVIPFEGFRRFAEFNGIQNRITELLSTLTETNIRETSERLAECVIAGIFPDQVGIRIAEELDKLHSESVAIRSSSEQEDSCKLSYAGIHTSFLRQDKSLDVVLMCVKECWASLYSERAIAYRIRHQVSGIGRMAVLVQEMVDCELSGVIFTVHPLRKDKAVIEYASVPCEYVVNGSVEVRTVEFDRTDFSNDVIPDDQAVGGDEKFMLRQLKNTGLKVERLLGVPADIEWCVRGGELYVLQARPVTISL